MSTEVAEQNHDVVLVQAERRSAMSLPESQPVAVQNHACPNLSQALSLARDRCKMADKGAYNAYHKYAYASADEVILTAKEALEGTGLAIIPQAQELTVLGVGNKAIYALNRTIFLSHSSGEFIPLSVQGWPVIPGDGRPLDKAFAIALTTSLSYLLRDLLQMPRGADADMNARNDMGAKPVPAKVAKVKCDGNHGGPACADPECWANDNPPSVMKLRNELGRLIREVAAAKDLEPDYVFQKLRDTIFHKFPDLPPTTSVWERAELVYAIESLKKALIAPIPVQNGKAAERQPGEDAEETPAGPPREPTPDEVAWMVARDQALNAMKSARLTWSEVIKQSPAILGRQLPNKALGGDLSREDFGKVKAHCEQMVKGKTKAA